MFVEHVLGGMDDMIILRPFEDINVTLFFYRI